MESLPNEMLSTILEYLEDQPSALKAAALTNRRLNVLASTRLPCYIVCNHGFHEACRSLQFLQRCDESAEFIKKFSVVVLRAPRWYCPDDLIPNTVLADLCGRLKRSTTLKRFEIHGSVQTPADADHNIGVRSLFQYQSGMFPNLKYLSIYISSNCMWMTPAHLMTLAKIPKLHTLVLNCRVELVKQEGDRDTVSLSQTLVQSQSVKAINLVKNTTLDTWRQYVQHFPNLTSFEAAFPRPFQGHRHVASLMIVHVLRPYTNTLQSLCIGEPDWRYLGQENFCCNLSEFVALKDLAIPAVLLFGKVLSPSHCPWSNLVWKALPTCLERLRLVWDNGRTGVFCSWQDAVRRASYRQQNPLTILSEYGAGVSSEEVDEELKWLGHLIREKEGGWLPDLRWVTLREGRPCTDHDVWRGFQLWENTDNAVLKECVRLGIKLQIFIRCVKS